MLDENPAHNSSRNCDDIKKKIVLSFAAQTLLKLQYVGSGLDEYRVGLQE